MPQYQSHISFSTAVAVGYALAGYYWWGIYPELTFLATVIVVITGMLPDIDASGGIPSRELGGLLAAVAPIALIELFPELKSGGIARVALVVICSYILTRLLIIRGLKVVTAHRGIVHSIPAAILTFELVYLLFWDLYQLDRLYIAGAAFVGYFSHLFLDGLGNVDLIGHVVGKAEQKKAAMKLRGENWGSTAVLYASVVILGWYIAQDFYIPL